MKDALCLTENETDSWASRAEYWQNLKLKADKRGRKPRYLHKPLILAGHGVRIRLDRGTLLVRGGFTHFPQAKEEWRFFPKDRRLPSRIVILDGDGGITFDALEWMATQGVPLVQINWRGEVVSVGGGFGYGADLNIHRAQLEIQDSPFSLSFAHHLIEAKIANGIETINHIFKSTPAAEITIKKMQQRLTQARTKSRINDLLVVEGLAAFVYFICWRSISLKWTGLSKRPIPNDWHRIVARMSDESGNQFAIHPVNAMLNYAYGMLENQVRSVVLSMGFDPTIGHLHAYEQNRPTLIFDLMEPLRPIIDRIIIGFIQSQVFSPFDFTINKTGVCKLNPQLARTIVKLIQEIPDIELITQNNLKKLLALHPVISKKASKNIAQFKNRQAGRWVRD